MKNEKSFYKKYWFIPHIISLVGLIISIIALILKLK